jgi:hypothetical protein
MIHVTKIFIAITVSLLLLYYSAAWAVLRCSHEGNDLDHEVALISGDPVHLNLECVGPDYHIELMAGSSSSSELDRLIPEVTRYVNNFLTLQTRSGDTASNVWLRAVFDMPPSPAFLIGLPSYLFLSVLRI